MNNKLTAKERAHLARVKEQSCSVCDAPGPSEAHHIEQGLQFTAIALCPECHRGPVMGLHGQRRAWSVRKMDDLKAIAAEPRRLSAVEAERDRLAAELSFINDTAREYFAKQGMAETLDAKHPALIVRQMASEILRQRKECDRLAAECEALRAALSAILKSPTGCQFCDYGKPRLSIRTGSPCEHDEGCGFVLAHAAMGGKE